MHRRSLIAGLAASAPLLSFAGGAAAKALAGEGWRTFELTTGVDLADETTPVDLWLPLAGDVGSYQRGLSRRIDTNGHAQVVRDPRYRERLLRVRWQTPGPRKLTLVETLATRDRAGDPERLSPAAQAFWTAPVASLPTDAKCPACEALLRQFNYRLYDLEIELCENGHGYWLEAGEDDRVLALMKREEADIDRSQDAEASWSSFMKHMHSGTLLSKLRDLFR